MNFSPRMWRPGAGEGAPGHHPPLDLPAPLTPRIAAKRDIRLDFFRGLGMLIILISHVPFNPWALWIPARFGFSDATEIFVFLSGTASAVAFGAMFDRGQYKRLVARILLRIWQLYWAHVGLFLVILALMALAGSRPDGVSYLDSLNLLPFIHNPAQLTAQFLALRYVPNYFDILPMYMFILALVPVMLAGERINALLPLLLMAALWVTAQTGLNLPAEPWSPRTWFFNPMAWQLCFFTGFLIRRGLIPVPAAGNRLAVISLGAVVLSIPFALVRFQENHAFFKEAASLLLPLTDKTNFGLLRLAHFLALAYLAHYAVGPLGTRLRGRMVAAIGLMGRQSLPTFVSGMVLAQLLGIALDHWGRTLMPLSVINIGGFFGLLLIAYLSQTLKRVSVSG